MKKTTSLLTLSVACAALLSACGPEGELPQGAASGNTEVASGNPAAPEGAELETGRSKLSVTNSTVTLNTHGGWGGSEGSIGCAPGHVAVGITGNTDWYVDRLALICAYLNPDGTLGAPYNTTGFGGTGGAFFWNKCPEDQAVVGFHGNATGYVDRLGVYCAGISSWRTSNTVQHTIAAVGGSGGIGFSEVAPIAHVVTSLKLRGAWYVDQIQGVVSYIAP